MQVQAVGEYVPTLEELVDDRANEDRDQEPHEEPTLAQDTNQASEERDYIPSSLDQALGDHEASGQVSIPARLQTRATIPALLAQTARQATGL